MEDILLTSSENLKDDKIIPLETPREEGII